MAQITLNSSGVASSGSLLLQTNGTTTQATVDTSGNLGLGVTPSAWTRKAFQLGDAAAAYVANNSGGATVLATNMYFDGSNKYATSAGAARYSVGAGTHEWYNAASGTAGNAITFTQAMTLDASGNLGVGLTSASNRIHVQTATTGSVDAIRWTDGATDTGYLGIVSGGGARLWAGGFLAFGSGGGSSFTERARIDSSGNLLVGTTTAGAKLRVVQNVGGAGTPATAIREISGDPYGLNISYGATPNGPDNYFILASDNSAARFYVKSNGGIANYSANNSNLSDERTKTDIQDAGDYLAKICAIPVRTFKYKDQTDDLLNLGVIAQEVEIVAPELVDVIGYGETPEDGVPLKAIYQTDLQYALMKCIQEQQAIITQLQTRITALENK